MSRIEQALRRSEMADENLPPELDLLRPAAEFVSEVRPEPTPVASAQTAISAPSLMPVAESDPMIPVAAPEPAIAEGREARDRSANEKLVVSPAINRLAVEQYRKLAACLHQLQGDRETKVVMIASAMAGEGKTLTATNIAYTLSESFRKRVLLIDADLRRPTVHKVLDIADRVGLNDVLNAQNDQKLTIVEVSPRLSVLPAGRANPDPMSGLTSQRMRTIIQEAAAKFDWVVLDTPPIELLPDASLLVEMVDAVVLVVGAGRTPLRSIERAVKTIDRKRLVGIVLNNVVASSGDYYYYGERDYNGAGVSAS